ncbi:gld-2, partial [Symbiodinium sp. CCMP2456]
QHMLQMPDYDTQEMAQVLPYPAVRPQVSRLSARSKPFKASADLASRTFDMRIEESRTNAIEESKIRAVTEPRITVTDDSASKTAAPGIKAIEEAKVPPTNGNNIRAFQDRKTEQEPAKAPAE